MKEKWNVVLATLLVIVFAVTRWPGLMPPNFSAAYALAFCAGAYLPARLAWWLPLATMLGTDVIINVFAYHTAPVGTYMLVSYPLYGLLTLLGRRLGPRAPFATLLGGGIVGAFLFYLLSNTFSWLDNPAYVKSITGWFRALTTGLEGFPPTWTFFKNTLLSGGLFTALFVGAMKLAEAAEPEPQEEAEADEVEGTDAEDAKA